MSDRELDAWISLHLFNYVHDEMRCRVCGWKLVANTEEGCVKDNCSQRPAPERRYDEPARYSTDLMLAFVVVERMRERGIHIDILPRSFGYRIVCIDRNESQMDGATAATLDDVPKKICLAAKQALEKSK